MRSFANSSSRISSSSSMKLAYEGSNPKNFRLYEQIRTASKNTDLSLNTENGSKVWFWHCVAVVIPPCHTRKFQKSFGGSSGFSRAFCIGPKMASETLYSPVRLLGWKTRRSLASAAASDNRITWGLGLEAVASSKEGIVDSGLDTSRTVGLGTGDPTSSAASAVIPGSGALQGVGTVRSGWHGVFSAGVGSAVTVLDVGQWASTTSLLSLLAGLPTMCSSSGWVSGGRVSPTGLAISGVSCWESTIIPRSPPMSAGMVSASASAIESSCCSWDWQVRQATLNWGMNVWYKFGLYPHHKHSVSSPAISTSDTFKSSYRSAVIDGSFTIWL